MKIRTSDLEWKPVPKFPDDLLAQMKWEGECLVPGTVVKDLDGYVYLIGDTNSHGGCCNCCSDWSFEDLAEYAVAVEMVIA